MFSCELNARYESRQFACGMVLAAPGKGESSTDRVFSGLCLVAENGKLLASEEKPGSFAVSEIDVEHMTALRRSLDCFDAPSDYLRFSWGEDLAETTLTRTYLMHPHLPETSDQLPAYCRRMLDIQVSGLVKRMEYAHLDHCVVGISAPARSPASALLPGRSPTPLSSPSRSAPKSA